MASYSNAQAIRALFTASLQSILKSPSALFFSIAFPLVFILVFGFLGNTGAVKLSVAPAIGADKDAGLFHVLKNNPSLQWKEVETQEEIDRMLSEGELTATIAIREQPEGMETKNVIFIHGVSSQMSQLQQLASIIQTAVYNSSPSIKALAQKTAKIDLSVTQIKEYKTIDFILPGQLGFSLLAAGVFGTAFVFFNLRQTLVLKRFFATPVRRSSIVLSEGLSRMFFQLSGAIIIIAVGYYAFGFTLINGWLTVMNMLLMCALAMMVFMGFGFLVSSLAKNETTIPPFSNLITLPQFLLAGTFFSIDHFPEWLQPICRILPLTFLNDALRKIAFDGANLWAVKDDIFFLLIWGIIIYGITVRVFKWE